MRLRRIPFLVAAMAGLLLSPSAALACACWANTGAYYSARPITRFTESWRSRYPRKSKHHTV